MIVLPVLSAPLLLGTSLLPASAAPSTGLPSTQSQEQKDTAAREAAAAGELEDSTAEVRAAAAALSAIAAQLPGARADVDRARGELAGAQAKADAAQAAVRQAERQLDEAKAEVEAAGELVEEGRQDVGRLARRSYQRGALGDLRDVIDADQPQDVIVRAALLRSVFRSQNDTLGRLTRDRLTLSRTRADLAAEERRLEQARADAEELEVRAKAVTAEAEAAAARVADLVARQGAALAVAEANRAQDAREYELAQQASRELAERIRRAAAEAAAAAAREAARQAAAAAAAKRAGKPAPAPAPQRAGRTGDMLWPAPGRLTSRYGSRTHPIYGDRRFHAGIDVGGGLGARVSASDGGTVIYAGPARGYGTLVVVSHGVVNGRDLSSAYAHMGQISVRTGQSVSRGTRVGSIGNEGNSTGPHLHFEIRVDGNPVDPLDYVSPP